MKNNVKIKPDTQSLQSCVSGSVILPTHLRIGNILNLLESEDDYHAVRSFDDECMSFKDHISWDYIGYDEVEAIPITEKLLLELGAIDLNYKNYPSYNLRGLQVNFVNGMWIEYVSRVELVGLHWLQNIFFFRMNEELCVSALTDR